MRKIMMTQLLILSVMVHSQGYPGYYKIDDSFTRGILRNVFNMSHEAITFGVYWSDLTNTYYETNIHRNRLRNISSINYNTTSPDVLIADYQNRLRTLNTQIMQITETNQARIDRDVRFLGESVAQIASKNNITTGNANQDWFIKELGIAIVSENQKAKYEAELRRVQQQARWQLERDLKSKMDPIKASVIAENQKMYDDYLKAAAYEASEEKEKYFLECRKFHKCFIDEVNEKYSIFDADWMNPKCSKPGIFYSTALRDNNYTAIAYRKKELYDQYGHKEFLDATNLYLEAALSENNREAKAYFLKAQMEDDIIQKKFYVMMAHDLDEGDKEIASFTIRTNSKFSSNLFSAIRDGNISFVSNSMKYKFHLGQTYKGKTPIEVSIDSDQSRIFKLLLDDIQDRDDFLKSNGYALLFHAAAVDARKCIEQLSTYGVPMNYVDRGNKGVTPLNIAIKNQSHDVADYLCNKVKDYSPALSFASKSGEKDLNDLSLFLYKHSNNNIAVISKTYPAFKYNNFGAMYISAVPADAVIYIDNRVKGKGNVKIDELELGKTYTVEIKKSGLQSSKRNVTPVKGIITEVKAVLQKPPTTKLSLENLNSPGYRLKTYRDYYEEPVNLKRDTKRNREFNNTQKADARMRAQEKADLENVKIKKQLENANSIIMAKNSKIEQQNAALESRRAFDVQHVSVPASTGAGQNKALLAAASKQPDSNYGLVVQSPVVQKAKYTENRSSVREQINTGTTKAVTVTGHKNTDSPVRHSEVKTKSFKPSTNSREVTVKSINTIPRKRESGSSSTKSAKVQIPVQGNNSITPSGKEPLFDLEWYQKGNGNSVIRLIDRNRSVNLQKSSAFVDIISPSGMKHDFSSNYRNGEIEFYPFSGTGKYTIILSLKVSRLAGGIVQKKISKVLDIHKLPENYVGLVERSMGSLLFIKPTEGCKAYPGMMVRAVRFNPLKPSDVAAGRITFVGEQEITIEVDQSFCQVQKGDLITMK